jgi:cytochrome c peroxidase
MIKLCLLYLLITIGRAWGSGTFFAPPPPEPSINITQEDVKQGKNLFEKKFSSGRSCASCHSFSGDKRFKRRKLARIINRLQSQLDKCITKEDRLGLSKTLTPKQKHYLRMYLAQRMRLHDYLR